ncbi:phosphopantetheine-binding protein [Micromonospora deserti]|uniref:Phosphopantetheine-binding protein n=1 Tax=Micromonospora deserti TaxID=2070366 RepID=A0A2W2CSQ9_9ACTN|nr:phosphopantetheine-binding protein [Micromonospora deserti]
MDTGFPDLLKPFLKYAGTEPITPDASLTDLGLDSMRAIELLFAIEDTYGVSMPDELLTNHTFATAGSLWATIESLRGRAA